jgi:hypothetical protein
VTASRSTEVASWRGSLRGHFRLIYSCFLPIVVGSLFLVFGASEDIRLWTGIVFVLEGISSLLLVSPLYVQHLSCTTTQLQYPKSFFRRGTIPLRDISGVGLVWSWTKLDQSHAYGKGWALTIWQHGVERPIRFPQFLDQSKVIGYQYPKRKRPTVMPLDLPSEQEQWDLLSESKVALIAKRIYEISSAQQGSLGYLATQEMQLVQSMETPRRGPIYIHAIWSPEGHLRRADIDRSQAEVQSETSETDLLT